MFPKKNGGLSLKNSSNKVNTSLRSTNRSISYKNKDMGNKIENKRALKV